jgi:hypothetical protein
VKTALIAFCEGIAGLWQGRVEKPFKTALARGVSL